MQFTITHAVAGSDIYGWRQKLQCELRFGCLSMVSEQILDQSISNAHIITSNSLGINGNAIRTYSNSLTALNSNTYANSCENEKFLPAIMTDRAYFL